MKLLGQLDIELNGKTHTLKPTFGALAVIEEMSGKSLADLVGAFVRSKWGVRDVAAVIYGGMYGAAGNKPGPLKFDEVGEAILSSGGMVKFAGPCGMFVSCAYSGRSIDEAVRMREELKKGALQNQGESSKEAESPAVSETSTASS